MAKISKKKQYVVLDVETNGLSSRRDDLLSISIYKPDDKKTYERFLPLEKQDRVLTTHINGIYKRQLKNKKPLSQEELDQVIEEFELDKRTILTYGSIDEKFIKNYLFSHHLRGYEKMNFYNFKHDIISSAFSGGNVTKDNLCKLYHIRGVKGVHNGLNDCILEWKLFDRMNGNQLLITDDKVFELNKEYIVPVSLLTYHTNFKYLLPNLPKLVFEENMLFSHTISEEGIEYFPNNMNGILIEQMLNHLGNVEKIDSRVFLFENKSKLKYIGSLPSMYVKIPIAEKADGSIQVLDDRYKDLEERMNKSNETIRRNIGPLISFINDNIFKNGNVKSQELVINKEANILALCDWSNQESILEIKAAYTKTEKYLYQLYYEAAGRKTYILKTKWEHNPTKITFTLHEVKITEKGKSDNNNQSHEKKKTRHKNPGKKPMTIREYFKMLESEERASSEENKNE